MSANIGGSGPETDPIIFALAGVFTLAGAALQKMLDTVASSRTAKANEKAAQAIRDEAVQVRGALQREATETRAALHSEALEARKTLKQEQAQIFIDLRRDITDLQRRDNECREELLEVRAKVRLLTIKVEEK